MEEFFMKSMYIGMSSLLLMLTPVQIGATEMKTKSQVILPTIEAIMNDYEVNETDAEMLLAMMQEEEAQYAKDAMTMDTFNDQSPEHLYKEQHIKEMRTAEQQTLAGGRWETHSVPVKFFKQNNLYNCGPAAAQMALSAIGINKDQAALAREMGTTSANGTSGGNITKVMNKHIKAKYGKNFYTYKLINNWDTPTFKNRVKLDMSEKIAPVLGVYQAPNGSRTLVGHTNQYLRHFVTVSGYIGIDGAVTTIIYNDPVSGYSGRFQNVKPKNTIASDDMAYLIWGGSMIY